MTNKEAIKELQSYAEHSWGGLNEAFLFAIYALEKQIPKKPKKLTYKLLINDGWIYECPTCGCACGENKYHTEVTQDDAYCTQCGQMLDWD